MKIKELMNRPLIIDSDVSLTEAARIMALKNIGSLIFMQGDKIKGLVTERDLLKNFKKDGKVSDVMETNVITISPNDRVEDALLTMKENGVKRLPVMDKGKLVGVVTLTDIANHVDDLEEDSFFD